MRRGEDEDKPRDRKPRVQLATGGHVADCGCKACGGAVPSQDEMLAHVMLRKADGGSISMKTIGAEEAPNMAIKAYVAPSGGQGLPVGGVDFQPENMGKQLMPLPPGQAPGQPPQGGLMPQGGPQAPMLNQPNQMLGGPPMPPFGQPRGVQSNILAMTPQGQAMQAMRPNQTPMPRMASGGSVASALPSSGAYTTTMQNTASAPIDYSHSRFFNPADPFAAGRALTAQYPNSPIPNMALYGGRYADELSTPGGTDVLTRDVNNLAANTGLDKIYKPHDLDLLYGGNMNDPVYQKNYARMYWNGNSYFVPDTLEVDPSEFSRGVGARGSTREEQNAMQERLSAAQNLANNAAFRYGSVYSDNGTANLEATLRDFLQKKENPNYGMPNPLNQGQGRDAAMKGLYHDYGSLITAFDVGRGDLNREQGTAIDKALEYQQYLDNQNTVVTNQAQAIKNLQNRLAGLTLSNGNTQSYDQERAALQGQIENEQKNLDFATKAQGAYKSTLDPYLQTIAGIQDRDKLSSADVLKYWFPQQAVTGAVTPTKMAKGGSLSVEEMRRALAKKPMQIRTTHEIRMTERKL